LHECSTGGTRPHDVRVAVDHVAVRVSRQEIELRREVVGMPVIVCVEECDELAGGGADAAITGCGGPGVGLPQMSNRVAQAGNNVLDRVALG
jgi:hypothetical protein